MTLDAKLWTPTLNQVVLKIGNAESNRLVCETAVDGREAIAPAVTNRLRHLLQDMGTTLQWRRVYFSYRAKSTAQRIHPVQLQRNHAHGAHTSSTLLAPQSALNACMCAFSGTSICTRSTRLRCPRTSTPTRYFAVGRAHLLVRGCSQHTPCMHRNCSRLR